MRAVCVASADLRQAVAEMGFDLELVEAMLKLPKDMHARTPAYEELTIQIINDPCNL